MGGCEDKLVGIAVNIKRRGEEEKMEPKVISTFFNSVPNYSNVSEPSINEPNEICENFLHYIDELNNSLEHLKLPSEVKCVYNPTIYARRTFEMYVRRYCDTKKTIMYFGMNPGPWGMSQTGVPFGEINSVRDWLGIEGPVDKPPNEIKERPVNGFDCTRTEVSGKRFWGLFKSLCGTPEKFFQTSFVYNYVPVQWMKENGCNLTPGDFRAPKFKEELFNICDPVFAKVLELYEVTTIVAIGKFCETRAKAAIRKYYSGNKIKVIYMPHPSPRAVNNNNWDQKAMELLQTQNLEQFYQNSPTN